VLFRSAVKAAAALLRELNLPLRFHGFVEGDDIAKGTTDVVVTDGFTGNVALKAMEGTAKLYGSYLRDALSSSLLSRLGYLLARGTLKSLRARLDPRRYNGGILLGLNGVSVKSHGGTDEIGFAHAVNLAANAARDDLIGRISTDLAQFSTAEQPDRAAAAL
jgi:glycerol-3-phosphate acyltransferase PlsX